MGAWSNRERLNVERHHNRYTSTKSAGEGIVVPDGSFGSELYRMIEVGWDQKIYPAARIAIVSDALEADGVPRREALRRVQISEPELHSAATRISVNQVIEVYRNAIRLSQDPYFAFRTGLKSHVSLYVMYGFAILSSMNFRQTMHFAVKYHQLATPLVKLRFDEGPDRIAWIIDPLPHPALDARLYRFIVEMQIGLITSLHRDIMGSAFWPSEVHVTFSPPAGQETYTEIFGCRVLFAQAENRLLYDASWLCGTPHFGNEITYATVLGLCDDLHDELANRAGIAGKVREILMATIGRHTSFENVATRLGVPVRSLRRKLREQGTSFRELTDQLRAHVAMKYLRDTDMTIEDIADALGFSDTANFRHAFHRWAGTSPLGFRRTAAAPRPRKHSAAYM
jgi:AraC-like DNA-binding protein